MAKVMVFALIILFLQIRPAGIFPQKGRAVDS
jgi:urea transport system permease protein